MNFAALDLTETSSKGDYLHLSTIFTTLNWDACSELKVQAEACSISFLLDHRLPHRDIDEFVYSNPETSILVFVEGKIYNEKDLSQRLGFDEVPIKISQLIYEAFNQWGPTFANELNGDFAITIYNPQKQEAFFYRDHIGAVPLAVSMLDGIVYFATDPMGLDKALYGDKKIDESYVQRRFANWGYDRCSAPHKEVQIVKPAHYLHISGGEIIQHRYWFPEKIKTDHRLTQEKVVADLTQILEDAIVIRSDKKYTAGTHLSGGLDSGVVGALSRKAYAHQEQFYGFSWTPEKENITDEVDFDERALIIKTADKNNIIPILSNISVRDYDSFVSDWRHQSEMLYERQTVQAAKERDVNLIFSGWGGDDFISIGHRGIDADLIRQFNFKYFLKKYPIHQPKTILRTLIYRVFFPRVRWNYVNYKVEPSIYPYLKKIVGKNKIPRKQRFDFTSRRKVHLQLLELRHLGARMADWYVHGQRNGVEYRYPLLDKRIVEYMIKVPSKCLVGNNHYRILLRIIGKELLPDEVLKNKSKDDPLKSQQFYRFVKQAKNEIIDQLPKFRTNPDLNFVDFDLIEKDLPKILENIEQGVEEDGSSIFFYLKGAHEFTQGYYANN